MPAHHNGSRPSVCFVGPGNLPALAPEFGHHGIGGMEVQQTLLARALARHGYDVSMVVADFGQPDGASWDGVRTLRAFRRSAGLPVLRFIHPRWTKTWAALKRANAQIYYVSGAGMLLGLTAMFARSQERKLVFRVASTTDCDPATLRVRYWRDRKLFEYGLRRTDVILAQTLEQKQRLTQYYGCESRVVPSMVATARRWPAYSERDIDVLWVGNIRALKRPRLLLDLARRMPDRRFVMAGGPYPGSQTLFEEIRREAGTLPNVEFRGTVPFHEMHTLYERARVLAGTSEIEGFPNIYLQAWSHGAPVVAYLDPEELIRHHALGHVAANQDEMAQSILALLSDESRWLEASRRCREYAASRLDENAMLAPYTEAFASLVGGSSTHTQPATAHGMR